MSVVSLRNGIKGKSYHLIIRDIGLCVDYGDSLHQLKVVLKIGDCFVNLNKDSWDENKGSHTG